MNRVFIFLFFVSTISVFSQKDLAQQKKVKTEFYGQFRGDYRYFWNDGAYPGQHRSYFSTLFQPEIMVKWNSGKSYLKFTGFARLDQYDTKRTYVDIRELFLHYRLNKWSVSIGAKKIFWGVTESNHLADIVNQVDLLEGFDIEHKLGQPMVHLQWNPKWGNLQLLVMPYHRDLQFPGEQGRLRPPFEINEEATSYGSKLNEYHPDLAVRFSKSIGMVDFGISHFYGQSRTPLIIPMNNEQFRAHYELINQTSIDLQAITGSMLWKLEGIYRFNKRKTITAFTVGGEYTFSNIFQTGADFGFLSEYTYDNRGIESINSLTNDGFVGVRITLNDRQSTSFLAGMFYDFDNGTIRYTAKGERRIGNSWKLSLETLGFHNVSTEEFTYFIREDSYLQVSLGHFF